MAVSSLRSWPAQNAGPLAASTTARTLASSAMAVECVAKRRQQRLGQAVARRRAVEHQHGDPVLVFPQQHGVGAGSAERLG